MKNSNPIVAFRSGGVRNFIIAQSLQMFMDVASSALPKTLVIRGVKGTQKNSSIFFVNDHNGNDCSYDL